MAVTDMTAVVTGPTRGLGLDTTVALAREGVRLVLMGRDAGRLDTVAATARSAGSPQVVTVECDFASLTSVRDACAKVAKRVATSDLWRLDLVIGNAGLQFNDRRNQSVDGYEATFAVNVLANHVLIRSLVDSAKPSAHVVVVGSGTHFGNTRLVAAPVWAAPEMLAAPGDGGAPFDAGSSKAGQCAYSTSKLAVNYLVHAWQRQHAGSMRFNIYDPGLMPGTGLVRTGPAVRQWAWRRVMPALQLFPGVTTTKNSAEHLTAFGLGHRYSDARAAYVEIENLSQASKASRNPEREQQLWDFCESVLPDPT